MPRKPSQANDTTPTRTHKSIHADIAEFRKHGGRIEVLGNTPLRSVAPSAFRSDSARRKPPSPVQKKVASR
jgi:hypothetical protein